MNVGEKLLKEFKEFFGELEPEKAPLAAETQRAYKAMEPAAFALAESMQKAAKGVGEDAAAAARVRAVGVAIVLGGFLAKDFPLIEAGCFITAAQALDFLHKHTEKN
jgi:hypothetical protein